MHVHVLFADPDLDFDGADMMGRCQRVNELTDCPDKLGQAF